MLLKATCHLAAPLRLTASFAYLHIVHHTHTHTDKCGMRTNGALSPIAEVAHTFDVLFVYI